LRGLSLVLVLVLVLATVFAWIVMKVRGVDVPANGAVHAVMARPCPLRARRGGKSR
jgi:hypothetical protein